MCIGWKIYLLEVLKKHNYFFSSKIVRIMLTYFTFLTESAFWAVEKNTFPIVIDLYLIWGTEGALISPQELEQGGH